MPTHILGIKYQDSGGVVAQTADTITEEIELEYEATLGSTSDIPVALAIPDTSKVKAVLFTCGVAAATIATNDTYAGSPQDTFQLAAGESFMWSSVGPKNKANTLVVPIDSVFAGAVTAFHVKGTATSVVKIRVLMSS